MKTALRHQSWRSAQRLPVAFSAAHGSNREVRTAHEHRSIAGAHTVYAVSSGIALLEDQTPSSYKEAMASKDRHKWLQPMKDEVDGCVAQGTWALVKRSDLPPDTNILPCKWVYKIKTDEKGVISKYKARVTPKGFKQKYGIDYFDVFANTGKYKTLRAALSIAARTDMELHQLDVPQAFIQAPLEEEVYMEMPEGFGIPGMVCRLLKSLYGLKQAPRNWYRLCSTFISEELGFQATVSDPCLFWKKSQTGKLMLLFLFVDDMQVGFDASDKEEYAGVLAKLTERFNISNLGESKYMLGMRITRDRAARTIYLDQELYITKALEKFGLDQCRIAHTPAVQSSSTAPPSGAKEGIDNEPTDLLLYQEKVGTLLYASISTRPDIAYAVNRLTQHMIAPTNAHAKACDRVFRYLAGTKKRGLIFGRRDPLIISSWADADWGSDWVDRKSQTGWLGMISGDLISWASKKQKVVAQSSTEAELYAEVAAINEMSWLRGLLTEIGIYDITRDDAPLLYGDNQSAQKLTENGVKSERTKHIDIKYHFITNEVNEGRVKLQWVPTAQQLADILTKSLSVQQHETLTKKLMSERPDDDTPVKSVPADRLVGIELNPGPCNCGANPESRIDCCDTENCTCVEEGVLCDWNCRCCSVMGILNHTCRNNEGGVTAPIYEQLRNDWRQMGPDNSREAVIARLTNPHNQVDRIITDAALRAYIIHRRMYQTPAHAAAGWTRRSYAHDVMFQLFGNFVHPDELFNDYDTTDDEEDEDESDDDSPSPPPPPPPPTSSRPKQMARKMNLSPPTGMGLQV
jgi:hypothetical protein